MTKLLHYRFLGLLLIYLFAAQSNYAQEVIHCWDFNGTTPFTTPLNTDNRVSGSGSITHNLVSTTSFDGSTINTCSGSEAGTSFAVSGGSGTSSGGGNNGKHLDFNFSSEGYENLTFSFWAQKTSTGFSSNTIEYSTDGTTFTSFPTGSPFDPALSPGGLLSFNLSSVTSIDNQSNLVIRIVFNGATDANGNNRIDNVKLEGTPVNPNDGNSQVNAPENQITANTIFAANTTTIADAEPVFSFDIQDQGTSDALPTNVTKMQFTPGDANTANWTTTIQNVIIKDDTDTEIDGVLSVFGGEIVFVPDSPIVIADNSSQTFIAEVVLNDTGIVDGDIIQFEVSGVDADFQANLDGSDFSSDFDGGDVTGSEITIDVIASEIAFLQEPSDVNVLATMSPNVEVGLTDINGNLDTSNTSVVGLTSSGDLDSTPLSATAVAGIATFSSITHNTQGQGLILTASTTDPFTAESSPFDVFSNDTTSEVVAPSNQVGVSTVVAAGTTTLPVFSFDIQDPGSGDETPTSVTQMRFVTGSTNTVDWSTFSNVAIQDASFTEIPGNAVVTANEVIFTPDNSVVVADGASVNFTVEVTLDQSNIIDESVIQFQVSGTNSGFEADFFGSIFNSSFAAGDVVGNNITLDVVATEIAFLQQPTDVEVNAFMTPAVSIGFVDVNGNVDISNSSSIDLSSSGGLFINLPATLSATNGVATFPNIAYSATATGLTLTAETADTSISPFSIISNPFNVGIPVIAIQDFDGTQPEWVYTTSIPPFDDGWGTDFFGVINIADASRLENPNFINNIFGENDLNSPSGTPGFASLDFVTVDISGYTGVNLSFDWEVVGYNVSGDRIEYQVTFDGVAQTRVTLFEGSATQDGSGTQTIPVPDTVSEVSFQYFIQNDGAVGFSGLDNVKLTGDSNARDTDITAPGSGQLPDATIIADVNDNSANSVNVFSFDVVDSGNFDNLPTNITRLRFVPGPNNTTDWTEVIGGISISEGTTTLNEADRSLTINPGEILIDITNDPDSVMEVGNGTTKTYTLSVFLSGTGITDQEIIQFAIADGNENQIANSDGSIFSSDITAFEGGLFTIDVVGSVLEFLVQPTTTVINISMAPSVRVVNLDSNGNRDLDDTISITISSDGTLVGGDISRNISSSLGYANFNTIQHSALGFGLRLTAAATGFTDVLSSEFNIVFEDVLLISEVAGPFSSGSPNADQRFVELFNMGVEPIDFSATSYYLHNATSVNSVQLTGILAPKSYYVVSFSDATTFEGIYNGVSPDLVSPSVITSNGEDSYYLSIQNTLESLVDVHGIPGDPKPADYGTGRFYRNIPTVRVSNPVYDEAGEWTKDVPATIEERTPGVGDNDFVYAGDWTTGIGDSPENVDLGVNPGKSIFVESGITTLTEDNTISDVVVRAGATLIFQGAVTLNGDFANFGKVIFSSTASRTAALGEFDSENRELVGNNFEIHRFIPKSNRAFRYLSSPVNTFQSPKPTIRDNWQEGTNNTQTGDTNNLDPNSGFGTHITGSTTGANGFDATETGNPSMFEWNSSDVEWNSIPNTSSKTFNAGDAYAILIRGDRSTTLNSNTAVGPATTLRTTGKLVVGSKPAPNLSSTVNGFSLIGNPYQAKVDMASLLNSDNANAVSSQFFYIYDPTIGTIGSYATVDLSDGTSTPDSGANLFLEPNQAFFVETVSAAGSPIVIFRESYKTTTTGNNTTFSEPEEFTNMNINLNEDILTNGNAVIDAVRVKFRNGGNNAKDTLDATKFWNYEESFAIDRNPNYMSIESRAMPTAQDSVPLYFGNSKLLAYRLVVEPENLVNTKAYLYDRYLESSTELPTDIATSVSFNLDPSIPESKATDRFVIKFEEVSLGTEDVVFNSSMVVYPNPVRGNSFSISHQQAFDGQVLSLKLFDLQGRLIVDQTIENAPNVEVNLNKELASGVYILNLSDGKASQSVKLMVK
ncbi:T9SS type A sorting domain-containing protein [Psychroflexus lacisalsi]|uniref:Secretion system C-terminal sorting domain-containing protein n=1 Tax=Psychroflexus lacisalsi TaxID=503928 RepID=A0ABN1K3U9_9FLAO|nr:T9SS type A sorting domain-containing protein [Psychroflexus lacisalsi]MBZ9618839.1 T9SS type A sorting domain-containing protein [Psychroflexus lacisalsi]